MILLVSCTIFSATLFILMPFTEKARDRFAVVLFSHMLMFSKILLLYVDVQNDSFTYFYNMRNLQWSFGTGFIANLAQVLREIVDNYFVVSIIFSLSAILSALIVSRIYFMYSSKRTKFDLLLFYGTIFSGIVFWGSGIGKDGIAFLGTALVCFSVFKMPKINLLTLAGGLVLCALVRPHLALLLLVGLLVGIIVAKDIRGTLKGFFVTICSGVVITFLPFVLTYIGLSSGAELNEVQEYYEQYGSRFEGTDSFVDIQSLPIPLKVLSFFVRPAVFEARGILQFAASLQNLLIVFYLIIGIVHLWRGKYYRIGKIGVLIFMGIAVSSVLSATASNLGLASRQKWMALIPMILAVIQMESRFRYMRRR